MKKLIVTDLDGTFLNDEMQFSDEFKEILLLCQKKNVVFCVCTGRQIFNVKKLFQGYTGIQYITNNGSHFEIDQKEIFFEIPKLYIEKILDVLDMNTFEVYAETQLGVVVQCSEDIVFLNEVNTYCENVRTVKSLRELNEPICKITITCSTALEEALLQFKDLESDLNIAISGSRWIDIMAKGCNKAQAVKYIQNHLNILDENTYVFGDYLNDLEMLRESSNSYAMKNAHPLAKAAAKHVLPYTNNEQGVLLKMKEIIKKA